MKKGTVRRTRALAGYLVFGLLLTAGLLIYRFPGDAVRVYLESKAKGIAPRCTLSIGAVSLHYTLGLRLGSPRLSCGTLSGEGIFEADHLLIRPQIRTLFGGGMALLFEGPVYGGVVEGKVRLPEKEAGGPVTLSLAIEDVAVGEAAALGKFLGRRVTGALSGTLFYDGRVDALTRGSGEARLVLSDGEVQLLQPLLGLASVDFKEIRTTVVCKDGKMDFTRTEFRGPTLRGELPGSVMLEREFSKSRLNLRGTIEPLGALAGRLTGTDPEATFIRRLLRGGRLSFLIQGVIAKPSIRFT